MNQTLKISGMTCNHCKMHVEKALSGVSGVESVSVDLEKAEAVVTGSANLEELKKAVVEAGYNAE